jgi:methylglutaconyl-CoA hydratase
MLASDIVIAAEEAKFGLPEPRRGIVAGMVSPLLVSHRRFARSQPAAHGTNDRSGRSAPHRLVPRTHESSDVVWARAQEFAGEIAQCAPESLQLTRRMLNETIGEHLGTLLSAGAAASATARTTEAAREGLAAFLEKREPVWQ